MKSNFAFLQHPKKPSSKIGGQQLTLDGRVVDPDFLDHEVPSGLLDDDVSALQAQRAPEVDILGRVRRRRTGKVAAQGRVRVLEGHSDFGGKFVADPDRDGLFGVNLKFVRHGAATSVRT